MLNFDNYLIESLNTPVDYYMTDDTVLPKRVYGAYSYDGEEYGISLEETQFDKIYEMKVYRLKNGKARYWKFNNPAHMRVALSTSLKFVEATVPFLKTKMDGVIIKLPKGKAAERVQKLGQAMIKRLYIQSFRSVPITIDPNVEVGKSIVQQYIFFARKLVNPKNTFNAKHFKQYVFDFEGSIPEAMAKEAAPKKRSPVKYSTEPSKKYSFGKLGVSVSNFSDPDTVKNIDDGSAKIEVDKSKEIEENKANLDVVKTKRENLKTSIATNSNMQSFLAHVFGKFPETSKLSTKEDWEKFFIGAKDDYGSSVSYDPYYIRVAITKFFEKYLSEYQDEYSEIKDGLIIAGVVNKWSELRSDFHNIAKFISGKLMSPDGYKGFGKPLNIEKFKKDSLEYTELDAEYNVLKNSILDSNVTHEQSSINPAELPYDLPGSGKLILDSRGKYNEDKSESVSVKENTILQTWGIKNSWHEDLNDLERSAVKTYTGSSYSSYNKPIRRVAELLLESDDPDPKTLELRAKAVLDWKKNAPMIKAFDKIKPIQGPLWVYRGGWTGGKLKDYLEVGSDYVETAFTSTSIRSTNTFGEENLRLAIYLPAGSKVLPVLDYEMSIHDNEKEVILPPMSVFRVIERTVVETYGEPNYNVVCVYKGSGYSDFFADLKKIAKGDIKTTTFAEQIVMEEKEKELKYNQKDKFGGKITDPKISKKVAQLIKSGKWRLDSQKKAK